MELWQQLGPYRAVINTELDGSALRASLSQIRKLIDSPNATLLQSGRHQTIRIPLSVLGGVAVVKSFGRQSLCKDLFDRIHGTKAYRSYAAASYLARENIGTTPPVACLERWEYGILRESFFISLYLNDMVCCRDILLELFATHACYAKFETLIRTTAQAIRAFHDAGCTHGDLGNQNIFFTRTDENHPYDQGLFLDLNRARFGHSLTLAERAKDLCRIALPPGFWEVFFRFYWGETAIPKGFMRLWKSFRIPFRLHTISRALRHPIRERRYRRNPELAPGKTAYPPLDKLWIWDAERWRPAPALTLRNQLGLLTAHYRRTEAKTLRTLSRATDIHLERKSLSEVPEPGAVPPFFRLIVSGMEACFEQDIIRLRTAGIDHALVRFSMSESDDIATEKISVVRRFISEGFGVAIQIVQVPKFVSKNFSDYVKQVVAAFDEDGVAIDWISVGQGVNTTSWAIRSAKDAGDVVAVGAQLAMEYSNIAGTTIEAPILQIGCGNITRLLAENRPYAYLSLAWNQSDGALADEVRILHALASRTFYHQCKILVISDEPRNVESVQDWELSGLVSEICVPEICYNR